MTACAGGGGGGDEPPATFGEDGDWGPESAAVRSLARATFGPTPEEIESVLSTGFEDWLDRQLRRPATLIAPKLKALGCFYETPGPHDCPDFDQHMAEYHRMRNEFWWQNVLTAPDQLRQRVAFALSEIFVVSTRSNVLLEYPLMVADFYDMLAIRAFGTYRDLLEEVTLHPAMGTYLSMVKNQRPSNGVRPDENYAREVMQLFSIGLEELNPDGTPVLDAQGRPIPTYDQEVIVGMARAFTGWNYAETQATSNEEWLASRGKLGRMQAWDQYHDPHPKPLVTGYVSPAGLTARQDLDLALDLLAQHPNVGPFIGRRLIQRLVTSNPSPEYVARVTAVFDDDGKGVRGNLGAVVRAILTDPEALGSVGADFGKVREPLLRLTALFRAFDARIQGGMVSIGWSDWAFDQTPLEAPSVFNFFLPDYSPPGPAGNAALVAPELQIATHTFVNRTANVLGEIALEHYEGTKCKDCDAPLLDYGSVAEIAQDVQSLLNYLDALLLGGTMTDGTRAIIGDVLSAIPYSEEPPLLPPGIARVREAVHLLVLSPDYAVQK